MVETQAAESTSAQSFLRGAHRLVFVAPGPPRRGPLHSLVEAQMWHLASMELPQSAQVPACGVSTLARDTPHGVPSGVPH